MFYRRKILLALLQQFGGTLQRTQMQKLLLLLTHQQKKPSFDFVPYKYGAFSFQVNADKKTMIKYGDLADCDNWKINTKTNYRAQLKPEDQKVLQNLYHQFKNTPSEELIRYTYQQYPFYAIRSEIADELLSPEDRHRIELFRPNNTEQSLYTIGYEGITAEEYLNKLLKNNINILVDVRKNSKSMKFGFSKNQLKNMCERLGIKFLHIPELGIESNKRKDLVAEQDYKILFKEYQKETLPAQSDALKTLSDLVNQYERVAITCFEKHHSCCHRHKISEYLHEHYGVSVKHL